jgi:hypothetical protein
MQNLNGCHFGRHDSQAPVAAILLPTMNNTTLPRYRAFVHRVPGS